MPQHGKEFKAKIVEKMMPTNSRSIADIRRETGTSGTTLYAWRRDVENIGAYAII